MYMYMVGRGMAQLKACTAFPEFESQYTHQVLKSVLGTPSHSASAGVRRRTRLGAHTHSGRLPTTHTQK